MRQKLSTGRYYVRVVGYQGAWSAKLPYRLDLDERRPGQPSEEEDDN